MSRALQLDRRPAAGNADRRRRVTGEQSGRARSRPSALILHDAVAPGAPPDEQDTLVQVAAVREALWTLGYRVATVAFDVDLCALTRRLREAAPQIVFNLVESIGSDARLIHLAPTLLEAIRLPYTGCDGGAMLATSNKLFAKRMLAGAGMPTPPWIEPKPLAAKAADVSERYIVKSVWEHASIGLAPDSIASDSRALAAIAQDRGNRFGGEWFAERFVDGREFNLSLLAGPHGPEVLPVAEIRFVDFPADRPRIVDYAAKWRAESFAYVNTPRSFEYSDADRPLLDRLHALALRCWALFDLNGYARVDFRVDGSGDPWILDINANPCLSPDAGFAAAAERAGLGPQAVIARILADCPVGAGTACAGSGKART